MITEIQYNPRVLLDNITLSLTEAGLVLGCTNTSQKPFKDWSCRFNKSLFQSQNISNIFAYVTLKLGLNNCEELLIRLDLYT